MRDHISLFLSFTLSFLIGNQYGITLQHAHDWPLVCLNIKTKNYVPMELCHVKLQPNPNDQLDSKAKKNVNERMAMKTADRRDLINYFAQTAYAGNEILKHYGITAGTEMRSVEAVVLPPPRMVYGKEVGLIDDSNLSSN